MQTHSSRILILGLLLPSLGMAEPSPQQPPPAGPKPGSNGQHNPHRRILENWRKADANNDGAISLDEFRAMERIANLPADKQEGIFKRLDKNGDGLLHTDELRMMMPPPDARMPFWPHLKELDKDGNGGISIEEFRASPMVAKLPPEGQERLFRRLDTDKDGQIRPKDHPNGPGLGGRPIDMRALFRKLDADQNDALSLDEFRKAPMIAPLAEERQRQRFRQLDQNNNQQLERGEFARAAPRHPGPRMPGPPHAPGAPRRGNEEAPGQEPPPGQGPPSATPPGNMI